MKFTHKIIRFSFNDEKFELAILREDSDYSEIDIQFLHRNGKIFRLVGNKIKLWYNFLGNGVTLSWNNIHLISSQFKPLNFKR